MPQSKRWPPFAFLCLLAGCSLFDTGESEPPTGEEGRWTVPVSPGIVISNLRYGFEDENIENYGTAFAQEDFLFVADPGDTLLFPPGTFADWDFSTEMEVTAKIFDEAELITLSFSDSLVDSTADRADFYENYEFTISTQNPIYYGRGVALFSLRRDQDGCWAIYRWQDFRQDTTDWGVLKGTYR